MKKVVVTLLSLLFVLFALAGCSVREIKDVTIKSGSFKDDYAVDERLDLSVALLAVNYGKDVEAVEITDDMLTGFDTTTTGNKTMRVRYEKYVFDVPYRVYNPENPAKDVVTGARFSLFADGGDGYVEYSVHFNAADLASVNAASFTLKSEFPLRIDATMENLTVTSDFKSASYKCVLASGGTALKVVLFGQNGSTLPRNGVLAKFKIEGGDNRSVSVGDIVLSDGQTDYYLPAA